MIWEPSKCCKKGAEHLQFFHELCMYSADATGWTMAVGNMDGEDIKENIRFCPWCGKKLPLPTAPEESFEQECDRLEDEDTGRRMA